MSGMTLEAVRERGHTVWAEVDLSAIRHNIRVLRKAAAPAEVMGVVKAYAYGHGNPASAFAMLEAGATRLGVARVAEAIHLREAGVTAPLHVFAEPPAQSAQVIVEHGLSASVYTESFARALSDAAIARGARVPVHVKVDTGMHRVGLQVDDAPDALKVLRSLHGIEIDGLWSHLAVADVPDHPYTRKQLDTFSEIAAQLDTVGARIPIKHIANSAAALALPDARFDLVRCGIASYGLWPGAAFVGKYDLKPAFALRARIGMVKRLPAGEGLSYGLRYELSEPGTVVTIGAGYGDGYDRRLSGEADVVIRGQRHRVSGTVCMDQFMVDVHDADAEVGDVATLIGADGDEAVTAEELAANVGTINYEVTTRIPSRVPRVYLNNIDGDLDAGTGDDAGG